jgi:hypothetical protein
MWGAKDDLVALANHPTGADFIQKVALDLNREWMRSPVWHAPPQPDDPSKVAIYQSQRQERCKRHDDGNKKPRRIALSIVFSVRLQRPLHRALALSFTPRLAAIRELDAGGLKRPLYRDDLAVSGPMSLFELLDRQVADGRSGGQPRSRPTEHVPGVLRLLSRDQSGPQPLQAISPASAELTGPANER